MKTETNIKLIEWFDDHWYKIKHKGEDDVERKGYAPSVTTKLNIISKPFLAKWRGDIGNREADLRMSAAADRGTRIHHAWYVLTTGGEVIYNPWNRPEFTPQEIEALNDKNEGNLAVIQYQDEMYDVWKLKKWVDVVNPEFIASELSVYRLKFQADIVDENPVVTTDWLASDAGTLDNLVRIKGGKYDINGKKPLEIPEGVYVVDLKTGKSLDDGYNMQLAVYADCVEFLDIEKVSGALILHTGSNLKSGIEGLSTVLRNRDQIDNDLIDYESANKLWQRNNSKSKPKVFEFPAQIKL